MGGFPPQTKKLFKIARVFDLKKIFSTPLPSKVSGYATERKQSKTRQLKSDFASRLVCAILGIPDNHFHIYLKPSILKYIF